MNKLGSRLRLGFAVIVALLVAACGGGGGGGGSPAPTPTPTPTTVPSGTWLGTLEDPLGVMHNFSVTTSGNSITAIRRDGSLTGQTGTITHRSGNIFSFTLSDTTVGGFFLDSIQTHAVFVDDDFNFGVVQLGATSLPVFSYSDLTGSYSGTAVNITAGFASFSTSSATATCNLLGSSNCVAVDSGVTSTVNLPLSLFNGCGGGTGTVFGRWCASSWSASDLTSGTLAAVMMSADKRFGGAYACRPSGTFPAVCEFSAWAKQ